MVRWFYIFNFVIVFYILGNKCDLYDREVVSEEEGVNLAKENNINYTVDIFPYYSSDVTSAYRSGKDFKGALIGTGVSASHGMERTHIQGIEATLKLIYSYLV